MYVDVTVDTCIKCLLNNNKNMVKKTRKLIEQQPNINHNNTKIMNMIECGRKEITSFKQFEILTGPLICSLISYVSKSDTFHLGGFIKKVTKDYFIYVTPNFKT